MSQTYHDGSCLLSPIDQLMPRIYTTIFLVFETDQFENGVKRLSEGLTKATSVLPFLRGSVHKSPDEDGVKNQLALSWSSSDPPPAIVTTYAPESLPTFETLKSTGAPLSVFQESLCPVSAVINYQEPGARAAAIVVGATPVEGGLILCLCAHHNVMDGAGIGMFLKLWGDCTNGKYAHGALFDPGEVNLRKSWLQNITSNPASAESSSSVEKLLLRHPEYSLQSESSAATPLQAGVSGHSIKCAAKIFSFSTSKLQQTIEVMSRSVSAKALTVNNILGAALWISITRIRLARMRHDSLANTADSLITKLGFAVNARSKLQQATPSKLYLGNLTMLKVVEFSVSELERIGETATADLLIIAPVVTAIAAATSSVTASHVDEVVSFANKLDDYEDIRPGWNASHGVDLTYTSWANLGMYDCDFGPGVGGKPRFVRIPYAPYIDSMVLALPRRRLLDPSDGDATERIEVAIMLNEQDMRNLEEDEMLRSWSTNE